MNSETVPSQILLELMEFLKKIKMKLMIKKNQLNRMMIKMTLLKLKKRLCKNQIKKTMNK